MSRLSTQFSLGLPVPAASLSLPGSEDSPEEPEREA